VPFYNTCPNKIPSLSFAEDDAAAAATAAESSSTSGVHVRLLYLKEDMSVCELPSSALHGVGAPELAAGAVAELEGGLSFKTLEVCVCVCVVVVVCLYLLLLSSVLSCRGHTTS
jgi:hypothetical protein